MPREYSTLPRVALVCDECGVAFSRAPHEVRQNIRYAFCSRHCWTFFKHITPEKFWSRVEKTATCWLWRGTLLANGYGVVRVKGKQTKTHRYAYSITKGAIPDGLLVLHKTPDGDNPACVNPAHLWVGTCQENIVDRDAKGRQMRGERHVSAKLTADQVREIRQRVARGESQASMSRAYGVVPNAIFMVVTRKTWAHVV